MRDFLIMVVNVAKTLYKSSCFVTQLDCNIFCSYSPCKHFYTRKSLCYGAAFEIQSIKLYARRPVTGNFKRGNTSF